MERNAVGFPNPFLFLPTPKFPHRHLPSTSLPSSPFSHHPPHPSSLVSCSDPVVTFPALLLLTPIVPSPAFSHPHSEIGQGSEWKLERKVVRLPKPDTKLTLRHPSPVVSCSADIINFPSLPLLTPNNHSLPFSLLHLEREGTGNSNGSGEMSGSLFHSCSFPIASPSQSFSLSSPLSRSHDPPIRLISTLASFRLLPPCFQLD